MSALVGLLVTPLLGYPLVAAALVGADSLAGERLFLFQVAHERRLLLNTFIADYLASLPSAYLVTAALVALAFVVRHRLDRRAASIALTVGGALTGLVTATSVTGAWFGVTHVVLLAAGTAYAIPLGFCVRRLLRTDVLRGPR